MFYIGRCSHPRANRMLTQRWFWRNTEEMLADKPQIAGKFWYSYYTYSESDPDTVTLHYRQYRIGSAGQFYSFARRTAYLRALFSQLTLSLEELGYIYDFRQEESPTSINLYGHIRAGQRKGLLLYSGR